MPFDLIGIILVICGAPILVYGGIIFLMFPAWLKEQAKPGPKRALSTQMGCLYLLVAPFRLLGLYAWRFILQPGLHVVLIVMGGLATIVLRFGILMRSADFLADNWSEIADRLWQDNLNAEALFRTTTRQNEQRTRSNLEQLLMRYASVSLLNRSLLFSAYDVLGVSSAIPTVLAAIASDEERPVSQRLGAVDVLRHHGFRSMLLKIAIDLRREGQVVSRAVEALEMRQDWHAAEQAWKFLLDHREPDVRLLAANHLKLDPANQGEASATLRAMFNDERLPLHTRIEAAGALGRVNLLSEGEFETLQAWMRTTPDPEAGLHTAFMLACLRQYPAAFRKLRRYCYEFQHPEYLRQQAIEFFGRLDRVNDLRPLGHLDWVEPDTRLRVAEILLENSHSTDAVRCWLAVSMDAGAPLKARLSALRQARRVYQEYRFDIPPRDLLVEALSNLGSDGEPAPGMRLEAARTLVDVGEIDPARQILLVLAQAKTSEPAIRRQASSELRRLSTVSL